MARRRRAALMAPGAAIGPGRRDRRADRPQGPGGGRSPDPGPGGPRGAGDADGATMVGDLRIDQPGLTAGVEFRPIPPSDRIEPAWGRLWRVGAGALAGAGTGLVDGAVQSAELSRRRTSAELSRRRTSATSVVICAISASNPSNRTLPRNRSMKSTATGTP